MPEPLQFNLDDGLLLALIPADGLDWVLGEQPLAPSGHSECLLGITVAGDAEVDQIIQRVKDSDGSVITEASREDWGYTAICTDPDGHAWQITASSPPVGGFFPRQLAVELICISSSRWRPMFHHTWAGSPIRQDR